ncbi:Antennal-enriched UDP-glycosyltransferase, partial [Operophtera brumata]
MASIAFVFLNYFTILEAARILVFVPVPSVSHQVVFRPLTQELVKRGHEVVVVTTDPAFPKGQAPTNLTEIDVHDISYNIWREKVLKQETTKGTKNDLHTQINTVFSLTAVLFKLQVKTKEFQNLIKEKLHFDLIIVEAFIKLPLSLSHVFRAPIIMMSSFGSIKDNFDIVGAPKNPLWIYPDCLHQRVYQLSILEKIDLIYKAYTSKRYFDSLEKEENRIAKRLFGSDIPLLSELANNVQMLFLNIYPIWELNRPVPPSVIFIGGIHQKSPKELPKDLETYLDSSNNGVIYVSFGTNVSPSQLPSHRIQTMVNVFSKLQYEILWKWDKDELPGKTKNIRIEKWVPQSDLLTGVPLIGIPLLGDQWFNVEHYVHHKLGLGLDMEALERAVWWTEHVLRHGTGKHLRAPAANMSWAEYLDVELITVLALGVLVVSLLVIFSMYALFSFTALERAVWWTEHVLRHGTGKHLRAPAANMSWAEYLDVELITVLALGVLVVICVLLTVANGAKILAVWPTPSISHQVPFRPLTEELARRGHEVTVITTDPAFEKGKAPPNLREIDLHDLSYDIWRSRFFELSTGSKGDLAGQVRVAVELLLEIFIKQLQTDEVKHIIENETFDLVFTEACVRPALLFSHIYKVPVIQVSSFGGFFDNYERMGAPIHPLVYPLSSRQRTYNLSVKEKATELYNYYVMDGEFQKQEAAENIALRKHFYSDMPTLSELTNNVQMLFLNVHPYWDGNRPVPPSVLYIGGIYQKPEKELPKPVNAASRENTDNGECILSAVLRRHPKVKLFVTQCGLQSTNEAIAAGVPLLGIPLLGDQWYNAEKYEHLNIGVKIDMDTLNEKDLKIGIYKILDNADSYRSNVNGLRSLMYDQPQSALERAVWWTEHVLRHGTGKHLRSPSANMSWAEYLELDLVLVFIALALAVVTVIGII